MKLAAWAVLVLLVLGLVGSWYAWAGDATWDDAFISFRYAHNLANGDGLVWNPGGEHTQGYTNFLFVILIALAIKGGIAPILAAYALNTLGLLLIVVTLGLLAETLLDRRRWAWILPPLALIFLPLVRYHMVTGMETVFWTGLVFTAILFAQRGSRRAKSLYLYASLALFFLATLTRPETVIIVILVLLYLVVSLSPPMRLHLVAATCVTGAAGLAYLYWANRYFPDFLPNAFYIKVSHPGALPGLSYVVDMLRYFAVVPLTYPGLVGLCLIPRKQWRKLLPYASVLSLTGFYIFVQPLMGYGYRFLFPVVCLIEAGIGIGVTVLLLRLYRLLFQRPRVLRGLLGRAGGLVVLSVSLAFLALHFLSGGYIFWLEAQAKDQPVPFDNLATMGHLLSEVDGIENVVVAFGDAGRVAYYSGSQFLDVVGLNENTIAREGNQAGADWVIQYVLDQRPDVIGFYTDQDGKVYQGAHGVLGTAYYDLYTSSEFQAHYSYSGGIYSHWGDLYAQLFVRSESPHAVALFDKIQQAADTVELGTLHP